MQAAESEKFQRQVLQAQDEKNQLHNQVLHLQVCNLIRRIVKEWKREMEIVREGGDKICQYPLEGNGWWLTSVFELLH